MHGHRFLPNCLHHLLILQPPHPWQVAAVALQEIASPPIARVCSHFFQHESRLACHVTCSDWKHHQRRHLKRWILPSYMAQTRSRSMVEWHLCEHADVYAKSLSRRLLFKAFWPLDQANACRQGRPDVQAANIILPAQPVQVKVMNWWSCKENALDDALVNQCRRRLSRSRSSSNRSACSV